MSDVLLPEFAGLCVARVECVAPDRYGSTHYRITFTDATVAEVHGGAVGGENADCFLLVNGEEHRP